MADDLDPEARAESLQVLPPAEARFEVWRRRTGIVAAPLAFALVYVLTPGLTPQGRMLAATLSLVAVLWVTEFIPLPATALLGAVLCILLGVADVKTVLAPFADPIVFLFIGSFILARAMMRHGLDRRIAFAVLTLRWVGGRPGRALLALGLVTGLLSMWVSNTATAAMMLPIALGMLKSLHEFRRKGAPGQASMAGWPFAAGMLLMVSYSASVGGLGTPVGTPPNLIGIGLIRAGTGTSIPFFRWMALACPILLVMGLLLFAMLYYLHPAGRARGAAQGDLRAYLRSQRELLGPWTAGQINCLIAFALAVTLWVLPGLFSAILPKGHGLLSFFETRVPESAVALVAALLLFILPTDRRLERFTLTWKEAANIDWGTILLFGGGLSLGTLMFKTGVADALGHGIVATTGASSLWALTGVSIAMAILLSEMTSNTAAANMVIPVVISLAKATGVDPVPPALGACMGASFGFMLPVSTPPNAIVYGTGLVSIPRMIRAGILLDVIGFLVIWGGLRLLCPLLGFVR